MPRCFRSFLPALLLLPLSLGAQQRSSDVRALRHQSDEWLLIEPHLPDRATAPPHVLETEGDVLRARRFPEDALDFYRAAIDRGGDQPALLLRMGVTELDMNQAELARAYFRRVTQIRPKEAQAWNNLGATEYLEHNYLAAVSDYRRAMKLNKKAAAFHSNLGTAYFELKDFTGARKQFDEALRLDPGLFQRESGGGIMAHILSPDDRARFCFEMAKVALHRSGEQAMLYWLAKAAETGYDLKQGVAEDATLAKYRNDERVLTIVRNSRAMRRREVAANGPVPALPAEAAKP